MVGRASRVRVALVAGLALFALAARSDAQSLPRYVAVLSSFEQQFSPHNVVDAAFRAELTLRSAEPIQFIDVLLPSMQSPLADVDTTLHYLRAMFSRRRPDLIVTVGGVAAVFAQKYRRRLFPESPILFASVDQLFMNGSFNGNETAVASAIDPGRLVENILQVVPDTRSIAVVLGNSQIKAAWQGAILLAAERFKNRVKIVWFDEMPVDQLLARSASLAPHSAILFAGLGVDGRGVPLVPERVLPQLRTAANAPIFGIFHSQLGQASSAVRSSSSISSDEVRPKSPCVFCTAQIRRA